MKVYDELVARGLIAQVTNEAEIREMIDNGKATFYIGFDPTADSLHVGHFMALCLMKRLQECEIPVEWRYLPIGNAQPTALQYLERNLFNRQAKPCDGSAEGVAIHAAANPYAEAAHIAKTLTAWQNAYWNSVKKHSGLPQLKFLQKKLKSASRKKQRKSPKKSLLLKLKKNQQKRL